MQYGMPLARASGRKEFPDCSRCRSSPELRDMWGCDAPAAEAVFNVACSACWGEGGSAECEDCGGSGRVDFHRCPRKTLDGEGGVEVVQFLQLFAEREVRHTYPVAGGVLAQAAGFLRACAIADHEKARWEESCRKQRAESEN